MDDDELAAWHEQHLAGYVADRVAAGEPEEVARRLVTEQHAGYFPDGRPAEGHEVLVAEDDGGDRVGMAWWGPHPRRPDEPEAAFLYDIEVDAEARGRGYGRALLAALEERLRRGGVSELGLNVFGDNTTARRLYLSSGYREVAVIMTKVLAD
jgi:ribosomal protein S18 acetylase RimI-like enzyme